MTAQRRKTNVMLVTSSLWIGGTETVVAHLARTIDRERFNVTVCYLKQMGYIGRQLLESGVDIVGIWDVPDPPVDYFTFRKLRRLIRSKRIDVVHTHTTHGLVDAGICRTLMPGLRLVHTFHFGNYPHTRPRIIWMERIFARCADRLFAVGEVQRQQVRAVHRLADKRIETIWNGVVLPAVAARNTDAAPPVVGTIATFIEQKGLSDLLHVVRRLRDRGVEARFVVVGDGPLRPELEALRATLGLDNVVTFPGWITDAALVALPSFDVFFQPSLWEAMSVVVLEAMAAAKPVVATAVGETPHVIEHGVSGLLVQPRDIDGMATALSRLLEDRPLRQRLGTGARRRVEGSFTVEHMTRAYERVYRAVCR